jgi:chorismate dehydratase
MQYDQDGGKEKIVVSVVSYLNSKPFIYGLRSAKFSVLVEITEDIPSECARKLQSGEAQIGLIPIAAIPKLKSYSIISDYCIGADGPVNSVLLLSQVPLNDIENILLDYQSRTSVMLTRILAKEFWKINPDWKNTSEGFEAGISGNTAAVVIGDRALRIKDKFNYCIDLSSEWKKFTGLPFVFACWVSTQELSKNFIGEFNAALSSGLKRIDEIAIKEATETFPLAVIKDYLSNSIHYNFDENKKKAMHLFLEKEAEMI